VFLLIGTKDTGGDVEYTKKLTCPCCGETAVPRVKMQCHSLTLFFIPVFKWKRRYFVQMPCCGSIYELDPEVGKGIDYWGHDNRIIPHDLTPVHRRRTGRQCPKCGFQTNEDFTFCPMCATRF